MGRMEREPVDIKLYQAAAECYRIAHACGCEYTGPEGAKVGKYNHIAEVIKKYVSERQG